MEDKKTTPTKEQQLEALKRIREELRKVREAAAALPQKGQSQIL